MSISIRISCFSYPSTIWRFAQDLIDVLPASILDADRGRRGPGDRRRAARAHGRRPARQPPRDHAAADDVRAVHGRRVSRPGPEPVLSAADRRQEACCSSTTCGTPARRWRAARTIVRAAGGTVLATAEIYDRMEAMTDVGVPNFALAEYKAPENYPPAVCPLCKAGVPITTF